MLDRAVMTRIMVITTKFFEACAQTRSDENCDEEFKPKLGMKLIVSIG